MPTKSFSSHNNDSHHPKQFICDCQQRIDDEKNHQRTKLKQHDDDVHNRIKTKNRNALQQKNCGNVCAEHGLIDGLKEIRQQCQRTKHPEVRKANSEKLLQQGVAVIFYSKG